MRTPWKMLADLVSGKSSKDQTETEVLTEADEATPPVADANKTAASADAAAAPTEDGADTAPEVEIAPELDALTNPATVDDTVTVTKPIDELATIDKKAELASPSTTSEKPDKPAASRPVVKAPAAIKAKRVVATRNKVELSLPAVDPVQEAISGPKSQSDEMADLDRDIEELRKKLAEKLKLQNAQLRKMIDRYESR